MSHGASSNSLPRRDSQPDVEQVTQQLSDLQNQTIDCSTPLTEPDVVTPKAQFVNTVDLTNAEGNGQAQDDSNRNRTTDRICGMGNHESIAAIDLTFEEDEDEGEVEEEEEEMLGTPSKNTRKRSANLEDGQVQYNKYHASPNSSKRLKRGSTATSILERKKIEVIDLTTDGLEIDHENIIDLDDIVSDGDEVQIVRVRNRNQELRRLKSKRKQRVRQVRDLSRPLVKQITVNGVHVEEGSCVEFQDGTFMKVCAIYPDKKHEFLLIGKMFTRITDTEVIMPRLRDSDKQWGQPTLNIAKLPQYLEGWELLNEVCQRIKIATGEADHDEGLWRRSSQEVMRARELVMTNQSYEKNCMLRRHLTALEEAIAYRGGPLRCRWKETIITDEYGKVKEHQLHRPIRDEVLPENFSTEAHLRSRWRGATRNLELMKVKPVMAEGFCGAGGMTLGALNAGMDVKVAFDYDAAKIATHDLNFPRCDSKQVDVTQWIAWTKEKAFKVDVVHLSPPCQPFSAANTTPNAEKNERNQAVLLACGLAIKCLHPRVVTIEESDGLTNRHGQWFGALVSQLTELGFSVRWACLKCGDFGVPQTRTRVFLIASA